MVQSNLWTFKIRNTYDTILEVTIANLRLIRDAAQFHSVSKAAKLNEMSQSAASQRIQELERELEIQLFDRSTRPLSITPAGKLYLDYCRDVLRRHEEFRASLDKLKKQTNGTVRLAAIYSVGLSEMSEIEERFYRRFPDAELQVSYLRPERVFEAVVQDQADLGLMSYAEPTRDVVTLPWREEEMVVAVGPAHELARNASVKVEALEGQPFIGFDEDLPIQARIDRFFRDHKVSVETVLRFDNLLMIKQAVTHGSGISIMPRRVMKEELAQNRMVALALDPPELYRPVRVIHRRRKVFNAVTGGLLDLLREEQAPGAAA